MQTPPNGDPLCRFYDYAGPGYRDRGDAGRVLASRLLEYKEENTIIRAIPNGGVPVGLVIAREIGAHIIHVGLWASEIQG